MTIAQLGAAFTDRASEAPSVSPIVSGPARSDDAELFSTVASTFRAAGASLERAQAAEHAFAAGSGGLQEMVFERARADAILNVASATASKATQSLNTILNMQV